MKRYLPLFISFLFFMPHLVFSQSTEAETVLQKSINYHDPSGKWEKGKFLFPIYESRPDGEYRLTDVALDNQKQIFELAQIRGKDRLHRYLGPDSCGYSFNFETNLSDEIKGKLRLNCDGGNEFYRNYYAYLYGLPMKLKDPGTNIAPQVKKKNFFGEELLEIKVTYDPTVGKDIWYFYFHPKTYALSGYRFYHDEKKNDGEYILLEGEILINGVKIPQKRAWYTHQEGKYLGNDDLLPYPATSAKKMKSP